MTYQFAERKEGSPARLIVVSEHAAVRDGLRAILAGNEAKYRLVLCCASVDSAIAHLRKQPSRIDLVLCDIGILRESAYGEEWLSSLRRGNWHLRQIALVDSLSDEYFCKAMDWNLDGMLILDVNGTRKWGDAEVVKAVDIVLDGARHYPQELEQAFQRRRSHPDLDDEAQLLLIATALGMADAEIGRVLLASSAFVADFRNMLKHRFGIEGDQAFVDFATTWFDSHPPEHIEFTEVVRPNEQMTSFSFTQEITIRERNALAHHLVTAKDPSDSKQVEFLRFYLHEIALQLCFSNFTGTSRMNGVAMPGWAEQKIIWPHRVGIGCREIGGGMEISYEHYAVNAVKGMYAWLTAQLSAHGTLIERSSPVRYHDHM
jgi:DNA-binding NarL/FixJ family response regulator